MSKSNVEKLMAKSVVCSFSKESISNKATQAALQKLEEKIAAELEKQIIILPKKMTMKTFQNLLKDFRACQEAQKWASTFTIEETIAKVERGDWLLWLAKKLDLPIKPLTLAKARCAKTVIHLMKDQRSIDAVNAAERFGLVEEMTLEDLVPFARSTYDAASAAAYGAYAAYAAYVAANVDDPAAYAASDPAAYAAYAVATAAAYTADAAANVDDTAAATYAADTAYAAAYANVNDPPAAYAAAYKNNQKQTADICREILGQLIIDKVNLMLKYT